MTAAVLGVRSGRPGTDTEYASTARHLAGRLASLARRDAGGAPVWTGDDVDPARSSERQTVLRHDRLDDGLLTGRAGIAVALAAAGRAPGGSPTWSVLASEAVGASVAAALAAPAGTADLGWCSGWLGVARAAGLIGGWAGDSSLVDAGRGLARRALTVLAGDLSACPDYPDLLDGTAGHLTAVLAADPGPGAEDLRRRLGTALLARLLRAGGGAGPLSWPMGGVGPAVVGLAHGGSGITIALAAARAAGLDDAARDVGALITRTLRWEDEHYHADAGGWPDLRAGSGVPGLAWCHGAPGVGIAAAYRHLVGQPDGTELALGRARRAVQAYGLPRGDAPFVWTLCHGLAGIVELHLLAAEAWPEAAAEHLRTARVVARSLTRAGRDGRPGWVCGVAGGRTPAVLTGLAGVALTLVRCHDPALAPSLAHPGLPAALA